MQISEEKKGVNIIKRPIKFLFRWRSFPVYELIGYIFMYASVPMLAYGIKTYNFDIIKIIILTILAMYSGFFAALIWNDITDVEIDAVVHPDRPITGGRISSKKFFAVALVFSAATFCEITPILQDLKTFKIKRYLIIQKKIDEIDIYVVIDEDLREGEPTVDFLFKKIYELYREMVGPDVTINIKEVKESELDEKAGPKKPTVISYGFFSISRILSSTASNADPPLARIFKPVGKPIIEFLVPEIAYSTVINRRNNSNY